MIKVIIFNDHDKPANANDTVIVIMILMLVMMIIITGETDNSVIYLLYIYITVVPSLELT